MDNCKALSCCFKVAFGFLSFQKRVLQIVMWVRILELHPEYYNRWFLWKVGNIVGKTLKVDLQTLTKKKDQFVMKRVKFARIYIEMDMQKQLIPMMII